MFYVSKTLSLVCSMGAAYGVLITHVILKTIVTAFCELSSGMDIFLLSQLKIDISLKFFLFSLN